MFGFLKLLFRDGEAQGTVASDFYREMEVDVLARTLWGEARGEGERGWRRLPPLS